MVEINEPVKSMNKGSKDCIQEGKQYRFPVFLRELDPEERTEKRIEDIDSIDECCYEHYEEELEEEPLSVDFDDQDDSNTISTKLYGTLNFKTAENLLLNGGRSTISAKSRRSRFEGDAFGISSDIKLYFQPDCTVSALVAHMLKSGILELFLKFYHTKSSQRRLQERFAIFPIKIVH